MSANETENQYVKHGLDTRRLKAFQDFARENPAEVAFEFEANGVYEGRAVHTRSTTGPYTLGGQRIDRMARSYTHHFGAHKEVEDAVGFVDPTDRQEVVEVALAALTGCINAVVSVSAVARGIELDRLETEVRISWDPAVFLHLRDVAHEGERTDQFGDLEIELLIAGDGLDDADISYLRTSVERSAVFNLVTLPHRAVTSIRVAENIERTAA